MAKRSRGVNGRNEIEQFLVSFFLIEVVGQAAVFLPSRLLRMLGFPGLHDFITGIPHFRHLLFTVLLLIAVGVNIYIIMCRKRKKPPFTDSTNNKMRHGKQ